MRGQTPSVYCYLGNGEVKVNWIDQESRDIQHLNTDPPVVIDSAAFQNREDLLEELEQCLSAQQSRIGIVGLRGMGKTSLVQHFFEQHRKELYDPIWLRTDEIFDRHQDGRPRSGSSAWEKEALLGRLHELLEAHRRAVLVFDNVQAAPDEVAWLSSHLPKISIIMLAWDAEALPRHEATLRLKPLTSNAAQELILHYCKTLEQTPDQTAITRLCSEILGNYPLALDFTGRLLQLDPSLTVTQLIDDLQAPSERVQLKGVTIDGGRVSIFDVLQTSYNQLPPEEQKVLCALAAAPPVGISEETMEYMVQRFGEGKLKRPKKSLDLGLLDGSPKPNWRGHRFRLRTYVMDFLHHTVEYRRVSAAFANYLSTREALNDSSSEVVALALEQQLKESAPTLPYHGEWIESLLVDARPEMGARVSAVLAGLQNEFQVEALQEGIGAVLQELRSKEVTLELIDSMIKFFVLDGLLR